MGSVCYIAGAGEFTGIQRRPQTGDYVIAADGGYDYLKKLEIEPDLVIGDFDSAEKLPEHKNRVILPAEKDDTDMWAALKKGIEQGFSEFHIYGGTGGRLSHTMANIQTLAWLAQNGKRGYLFGEGYTVTAITDDTISFDAGFGKVSMFAHSNEATGVYIRGMKYPLKDATVTNTYPIGISNERMGVSSEIEVKKGTLILIYEA